MDLRTGVIHTHKEIETELAGDADRDKVREGYGAIAEAETSQARHREHERVVAALAGPLDAGRDVAADRCGHQVGVTGNSRPPRSLNTARSMRPGRP